MPDRPAPSNYEVAANAMTRRQLTIGITIGLNSPGESLWTNGIKQNALFLAKLFMNSPWRHDVRLLNTTNVPITSALPWDLSVFRTEAFDKGCSDLDVLIELGGQISAEQTARVKKSGSKIVSYCCGPEYIQNIEAMIFNRPLWDSIFINTQYDEMWVIPQIVDTSMQFLKAFRKCPARPVPFVWDPMALEALTAELPDQGEYRPRSQSKRLTIIEPNIDVLKFCLIPILAVEAAWRNDPTGIEFLHVANSDHMVHQNREFAGLMRHLDIVKAGKASFIGRVVTPTFLSDFTDIVVSHQWGLPLNYFYLECCWQGYPLIHNAEIIEDLGYYYRGNDIEHAGVLVNEAVQYHDQIWDDYRTLQRERIQPFLATNRLLAEEYDELLFNLVLGQGQSRQLEDSR